MFFTILWWGADWWMNSFCCNVSKVTHFLSFTIKYVLFDSLDFVDPLFCVITFDQFSAISYFNILIAVFQQCSQNLNMGQVFWNVLSVTVVTVTVMTKYDPWAAYRPLSLWRPDLDSFSLLWSHVKRLSILWLYWSWQHKLLVFRGIVPRWCSEQR